MVRGETGSLGRLFYSSKDYLLCVSWVEVNGFDMGNSNLSRLPIRSYFFTSCVTSITRVDESLYTMCETRKETYSHHSSMHKDDMSYHKKRKLHHDLYPNPVLSDSSQVQARAAYTAAAPHTSYSSPHPKNPSSGLTATQQ
jgi:hypothetical protein